MPVYRQRDHYFQAFQYREGWIYPVGLVHMEPAHQRPGPDGEPVDVSEMYFVESLTNGIRMYLKPGDYIIPEDATHAYVLAQSVFERNYVQFDTVMPPDTTTVYGTPVLKPVLERIMDLEKIKPIGPISKDSKEWLEANQWFKETMEARKKAKLEDQPMIDIPPSTISN